MDEALQKHDSHKRCTNMRIATGIHSPHQSKMGCFIPQQEITSLQPRSSAPSYRMMDRNANDKTRTLGPTNGHLITVNRSAGIPCQGRFSFFGCPHTCKDRRSIMQRYVFLLFSLFLTGLYRIEMRGVSCLMRRTFPPGWPCRLGALLRNTKQ